MGRRFASEGKDAASGGVPEPTKIGEEDGYEEEENLLEGKRTRENIHAAFSNRAVDAIRYDYFAQRADLEAEVEAASAFRSLTETAKQQAMGYLELLEEYGDAGFGSTVENLDISAVAERENAEETYRNMAGVASEEDFDQIEEWFEDMANASVRAANRLDLVSSMIDAEAMGDDIMEDDGDDIPEKAKH